MILPWKQLAFKQGGVSVSETRPVSLKRFGPSVPDHRTRRLPQATQKASPNLRAGTAANKASCITLRLTKENDKQVETSLRR